MIPTLTILGLDFAVMLGNAFLVEKVFAWGGLAQYGVEKTRPVAYNLFNQIYRLDGNNFMGIKNRYHFFFNKNFCY